MPRFSGEVVGGYLSNSLAIMTDAAHLFSDFASFCISLTAIWLSSRSPRKAYNYGYYRAEALGALFTVVLVRVVIEDFLPNLRLLSLFRPRQSSKASIFFLLQHIVRDAPV